MTAPALELRGVVGRSALGGIGDHRAISFSLRAGEVGVILGGKEMSSLFRLILGQGELSAGSIALNGRVAIEPEPDPALVQWLRQEVGFGFRDRGLLSNLSILDNVDLPAKYHGRYEPHEAPGSHGGRALDELKVDRALWHLRPSAVSWEVRKLVLLARAIVMAPKVLVLDDPSALFASTRLPELMRWLKSQKQKGTAVLLGTNDYSFGLAVADWVLHPQAFVPVTEYAGFVDDMWIQSAKLLAARNEAP